MNSRALLAVVVIVPFIVLVFPLASPVAGQGPTQVLLSNYTEPGHGV
jgi:hypothetical protein